MPRREDLESILILGSGPIVIGQACEFDYSGVQACKSLRSDGYRIILINSNPATIMTDPGMADRTYVEPITPEVVAKIIEKERPDAILPTLGGQTALNCAMQLHDSGVLDQFDVEMIGARPEAILKAEGRQEFREAMESIGLACARSKLAYSDGGGTSSARRDRPALRDPPRLHHGRQRWRHRLQPGRVRGHLLARPRTCR